MANLLKYLLGYKEIVHQKTASCCPDSGLVEEYECTVERCTGICLYPNNSAKSVQSSLREMNKDKYQLVYMAETQADPNNNAKLKASTDEISIMSEDKCNLVYTATTQPTLKNTHYSDKAVDLISRIKQIYKECKCKPCDCVAGIELPFDPTCQAGKEGKCSCQPCDCLSRAVLQSQPKETYEESDGAKGTFLWKEKFFCSIERTANACNCKPCDCVMCNKDKSGFGREAETQTNANYKSFNYDCRCNPCECIFCKALSNPECKCRPCECKTCPNLFISKKSIHPMSTCILNTSTLHECSSQPTKLSKISIRGAEATLNLETKSTSVPINFKEKLPSFYHRIVADMPASEGVPCVADGIAVPTMGEEYTATKEKEICDCTKCECVYCKIRDTESSSAASLSDDDLCKNCNLYISKCNCESCECEVCKKRKAKNAKVSFSADDEGEITCQCEDEGRIKCICGSECTKEETIKCCGICDECHNDNHEQCTNKACKCEKNTEEPKNEFNADGHMFPFLRKDKKIYAILTVPMGGFLKQKRTETSIDTDSYNLLTDIYEMNEVTKAYLAQEKQVSITKSMRCVDNMKLSFPNNEIDCFVDFDDGHEYDVHIDDGNTCLYHYQEKTADQTTAICTNYMDLHNQNGTKHFDTSDLLPIVDDIDEEIITKNYFAGYRPLSNKSSGSSVMCQYASSYKWKNQTVKYQYDLLGEMGKEIDVLINQIGIDNTKFVAETKSIRKSSNLNNHKILLNNNKPPNKNILPKYLARPTYE